MRLPRCVVPAAVAGALVVPAASAQEDLLEKLKQLRIRHTTANYELAGTITQPRLEHFGEALEFIHREYSAGFDRLLGSAGGAGSAEGGASGPAANGPTRQGGRAPTPRRPPTRPMPGGARPDGASQDADPDGEATGRHRVILFATADEYDRFTRAFVGGAEFTTGMYVPAGKLLLVLDDGEADQTYETLFHEAFHQFLDRHVPHAPMWLNEGLATHYGHARPTGKGLKFIRSNRLDLLKAVLADRRAIPLFDVVTADRAAFYDTTPIPVTGYTDVPRAALYYAEASTLVQMLIADAEGLRRLQDYIRELAASDGSRNAEITAKYFDRATCERLSSAWATFVDRQ